MLFAWLLNAVYLTLLLVLSPAIVITAWRTGKYREGWGEKFFGFVPERTSDKFCVWLHAVSVGEVNLLATTLAEIKRTQPDWEVVISTTTKTGFDLANKKYAGENTVFYCPLDFSWATNRAMRRIRPNLLVLAELELWPNLIRAANGSIGAGQGAKVAIINGRLSDNSFRGYHRVGWLVRRVMQQVDLVAAQDEATAERFRLLGALNVTVTGSLKYDGAETNRGNAKTISLAQLAGFDSNDILWLAGSTQAPEEAICLKVFNRLREEFPRLRLVLVPRHPERFDEVATLLDRSEVDWGRRSLLGERQGRGRPGSLVLLVDAVGELGAWWGTATIGFVGGSFGDRGGQNMIEPAAYGVATCFGPNTKNFRDIVAALLAADGAQVVQNSDALEAFVRRCLEEAEFAEGLGDRARTFVATQLGATERTIGRLTNLVAGKTTIKRSAA